MDIIRASDELLRIGKVGCLASLLIWITESCGHIREKVSNSRPFPSGGLLK